MRAFILICLFLSSSLSAHSTDQARKEGSAHGKESKEFGLKQLRSFSIEGLVLAGEEQFNAETAARQVRDGEIPQTEVVEFLLSEAVQKNERENNRLSEDEYFFKRTSIIDENPQGILEIDISSGDWVEDYTQETCQEAASPYTLQINRFLHVDVQHESEEKQEVKHCIGHCREQRFFWKEDAENWVRKQKEKLSKNPSTESYKVYIASESYIASYIARAEWTHKDDANECDRYTREVKVTKPEKWEQVGEKWIYEDESVLELSQGPDYALLESVCLDSSSKQIEGREVIKPCWHEKLVFLHQHSKTKQCTFLKERNCQEMQRRCVQEGPFGCALWEITYKCFGTKRKIMPKVDEGIVGLHDGRILEYEKPETSFSEVHTKLAVFEEIKRDLSLQNASNATHVQLFKGKQMSCSKSITDKLLYDCCFSFKGLASELKLSQCSGEEIALADMRERELCHYIGRHKEKFLDLWESRDEHTFCCFSSKLARVFQEEARRQLSIAWGDSKRSDCRGLTLEELTAVDFSKLDLSEVYSDISQEKSQRLQKKLESVKASLQNRLVDEVHHAAG